VPSPRGRRNRHLLSRLFVTLCVVATWPFGAIAQDLPVVAPQSVGLSLDRLARVTQRIRDDINDGKIPGAVMLVARHGKVAHFEALGALDRQTGAPMVKDAVFRVASMTKPITIVGALTLIEEGRLRLNTPIARSCRSSLTCGSESRTAIVTALCSCLRSGRSACLTLCVTPRD